MNRPLLEVCVDNRDSAMAAIRGGADRIELCAALSEGGLTPSAGFMTEAASWPVPVYAMIRPRGGDFTYTDADAAIMEEDIARVRAAGLAGIVVGAVRTGRLDAVLLKRLLRAAGPLGKTLHRAVDTLAAPAEAVGTAVELGFERILTSGGAENAADGAPVIAEMVARAGDRIVIMPGAGLTPENTAPLVSSTGVSEVHSSCTPSFAAVPRVTDEGIVKAMIAAIST